MIKFLCFVLASGFLLSSCKKSKSAEPAFFLRASEVAVSTDDKQGSGSHKITDLWLYVNGKFQGTYPTGAVMPVISKNEPVHIDIFAGIKNNGISSTRIYWDFYNIWTLDTLIESGSVLDRKIVFQYNPNVTFAWTEDFEGTLSGFKLQRSAVSSAGFTVTSAENAFEGRSIEMGLDGTILSQIETSEFIPLPSGNPNVYLELNYKGDNDFLVGLIGEDGREKTVQFVKAQKEWNKIYIQLSTAVSSDPVSKKYKLFFHLREGETSQPKIYLDNIKILTIQ